MTQAEFDQHAEAYERCLRETIAITGEGPEYFSEYKVADTQRICVAEGLAPKRVLDFGAGIGNSTPYLHGCFPGAEILAADVSQKSLEILDRRFPTMARCALIEGGRIPAEDGSVDLAFTACVFHHIEAGEHLHWLKELRRVVRQGGLFVLFEHNPYNPLTVRAVNTCLFDEKAVLIKAGEMAHRLREAGWSEVTQRYRIFFPAALAAARPLERWMTWLPLGGQYSLTAKA
jgi:ubiquinone/menaquinone biosynthesis C-methylase UbiE